MTRAPFPFLIAGPGTGCGRYVGRVGALAVALGVGVAVATGQGVGLAHADDAASNSSPAADAAPSADAEVSTPSTGTATSQGSTTSEGPSSPSVPSMNVQVSGTATVSGRDDDEAPAGGPSYTSDDYTVEDPDTSDVADTAEADEVVVGESDSPSEGPTPIASAVGSTNDSAAAPSVKTAAVQRDSMSVDARSRDTAPAEPESPAAEIPAAAVTNTAPPALLRTSTATAATTTAAVVAPAPVLAPQDPISAFIALPGAILSAVLSSFLSPGPVAPPRPPLLLAVLSLVAREIQRILFNATPVAHAQRVDVTLQDPTDVSDPIAFDAGDSDGDPLVYTVPDRGAVGGPTRGTVTIDQATGAFVYNPDDDLASSGGEDSFTVTISDAPTYPHLHGLLGLLSWGAFGHSTTATVTVNVIAANDAPVANDDDVTTNEDTAVTANVRANDFDSDSTSLTVSLSSPPAHGVVNINTDGIFTYVPNANFNGVDSFTYTLSDGVLTDTATVRITVASVNDGPVAVDDEVAIDEDGGAAGNVLTNDRAQNPDGPTELLTVTVGAFTTSNGTLLIGADGAFTYTPVPDFTGVDVFTYTVTDGERSTTGTLTITVRPVDDAVIAVPDDFAGVEDQPVTGNVLTNDRAQNPDGPSESLTVTPGTILTANGGSVTIEQDGDFVYTPAANFNGTDSFTYTVADGTTFATGTVGVTVAPVDDALTAIADAVTIAEDSGPVSGNVLTNDRAANPDGPGEELFVMPVFVGDSVRGTVQINGDGTFTYTPGANYFGTFTVPYTVTDATGSAATATLTLTVTPVNDPITAIDETVTIDEDAAPISGDVLPTSATPIRTD